MKVISTNTLETFKRIFLLLLTTLMIIISSYSQEKKLAFELTGSIRGMDSGSVEIFGAASEGFRNLILDSKKALVEKGYFHISGSLAYPHAMYAVFNIRKKSIHSEMFFIQPGKQHLACNIDSILGKSPIVTNDVNNEFTNKFLKQYSSIALNIDMNDKEVRALYKKYNGQLPDFEKEKISQFNHQISISTDSLILSRPLKSHFRL